MSQPATAPFRIVMLAYPRMTQLDLTGPFEVFARLPGARLEIVAESCRRPVVDVAGLAITANSTFNEVAGCELLFVPGGPGQLELMDHGPTLDFLRRMAVQARYVTSVCTGSLILGAAGLLTGYRATSHWLSLDQLALLGAIPVEERVVVDRNRFTGAGVSSGIDLALALAAEIAGEDEARRIALAIEYQPAPAFPPRDKEDPRLVAEVRENTRAFQEKRVEAARRAGARL
ncbi:UNVERIFIED_ORG: cyclohexyl-isocyanide hydratase [Xanthobacter viscosus]|jgi:cyclohexyl-isocyanide hydratase|uniref:DJ-1/PfpI family protein n=1 Tax=Xanthobacter autotrophicus TaxID=280 RepID=A0A6C1K9P5_XANAU|nr:DJ-1/PfpI family protein [Xanthobacter autotrophicus]TLX41029.1 DJ-1/PfpI family protein [Xanthobacter autotrophicus]